MANRCGDHLRYSSRFVHGVPLNSHSLNHSSSVVPYADSRVEHAVVRDQALEAVGVAFDPVDGVSAVAGAQRALAVFVDEGIGLLGVVEAQHQVLIRRPAPVAVDGVNELLPVAGRAVEVDHHDDVAVGGEQLGIPAIRPVVAPRALRAAVDEELHRILLVRRRSSAA